MYVTTELTSQGKLLGSRSVLWVGLHTALVSIEGPSFRRETRKRSEIRVRVFVEVQGSLRVSSGTDWRVFFARVELGDTREV